MKNFMLKAFALNMLHVFYFVAIFIRVISLTNEEYLGAFIFEAIFLNFIYFSIDYLLPPHNDYL